MINRAAWLQLICLCLGGVALLPAQVEFHGDVYPLARVSFEQRYLSLPHRLLTLEGTRRGAGVSLFFSTALEYRLGENTATLDLREAYTEVATNLGDLRVGKQIIAWGAADGNNPTDNVSPYDFYYLFLPGTERKLGNLAASANLYLGTVNLEAVLTPVFQPNRLPLNEPDFPVLPTATGLSDYSERRPARIVGNSEWGIRAGLPMAAMDLSLSYFRGFDRMLSPQFDTLPGGGLYLKAVVYSPTQVMGADVVFFLGNWGLRAEGAYILTEDREGTDPVLRNPYLQYVLQVDRAGSDASLMVQYLGTTISLIDEVDVFNPPEGTFTERENEYDHIPPKMGMPFAAIAQNALLAAASYDFADGRYSLQANALYELDHQGYMLGGRLVIALEDAFDLEAGITYLGGSDESRLSAIGEVFSHVYLGLRYSF
ncbi:MAG: DUF1302 family protein [Candidatus Neomarinimicrobiota bacterium]